MKFNYTLQQYKDALNRERSKRTTTYPKLILKMEKLGASEKDIEKEKAILNGHNTALLVAIGVFDGDFIYGGPDWILAELIREYKMRKKIYPRFVFLKRISQDVADFELSVWRELCIYFIENFMSVTDAETYFYACTQPKTRIKNVV